MSVNGNLITCDVCGRTGALPVVPGRPGLLLTVENVRAYAHENGPWQVDGNGRDLCPTCSGSTQGWHWLAANQYVLIKDGRYHRQVNVRDPYFNEPDGTKFVVTGPGHSMTVHDSLDEAVAAAEASA